MNMKPSSYPTMTDSNYRLLCGGLDYEKAPLEIRECFSFTKTMQQDFYEFVKEQPFVLGAVLLSTCNRMELFVSTEKQHSVSPFSLICNFLNLDRAQYQAYFKIYQQEEVFTHLCHLASGLKSQIFGEDQIITQVKLAQVTAREFQASDGMLEVLFRLGITCGKKIRTELNLAKRDTSMSKQVVTVAKQKEIQHVLVIGNGEMARHVGALLIEDGLKVTMSVRSYRHSEVQLPKGVTAVDYGQIYEVIPHMDGVVSATLSPHFTLNYAQFSALSSYPKVLFDLAVPRDIDPTIATLPKIELFNVDQLSQGVSSPFQQELQQEVDLIVSKYKEDLRKWVYYKEQQEGMI